MLVARLFAWLDRVLGGGAFRSESGVVSVEARNSGREARPRPERPPLAQAALLSVDGAGQFLLCGADRLSLGHLRAGQADLGFLADVGALHAELARSDSFQLGPGWNLTPHGAERVRVDGRELGPEGARLASGERVRLGENLEFKLDYPDAASASAVLELLLGAQCGGARHVILLAPGRGGRVRIGATLAHHVRVAGLEFEIVLEWSEEVLHVRSDVPLEGVPEGESPRVSLPPSTRVAFSTGKPHGSRPPFGFSIESVARP